jgi:hypothetical protein
VTNTPEHDSPIPDPAVTPGLEPGGGIAPGDTPATADQMSGIAEDRDKLPNQGPIDGNRTPMFIALAFIALIVISIAVVTVASFVTS